MHAYGRRRHHRRRMRGGALKDWLRKAHSFIKENKLLSSAGHALSGLHPGFGKAANVAAALGYGRRRRHRGRGVGLAGSALRLAGAAARIHPQRRGMHGRFVRSR